MADLACRPGAAGPFVTRRVSEGVLAQDRRASEEQVSLSPWERVGVRVFSRHRRRGFTLLELLIAMALTLLLVYALAEFYAYVGDTVRDGRALIEMSGDLRSAVQQLRDDLNSLTVRPSPPVDEGKGAGSLEIVEGPGNDHDPNGDGSSEAIVPTVQSDGSTRRDGVMLGDNDDILSMTIRSSGSPFVGRRYNPAFNPSVAVSPTNQPYHIIESSLAEVVWFSTYKEMSTPPNGTWDADEPRFLVRRLLLIRPDLGVIPSPPLATGMNFFHYNDISAHVDPTNTNQWIANSLDALSRRENRFIHQVLPQALIANNGLQAGNQYLPNPPVLHPFVNDTNTPDPRSTAFYTLQTLVDPTSGRVDDFQGEDHLLPNLLAFDVRVYDPFAPLLGDKADVVGAGNDTQTTDDDAIGTLQPGDPAYVEAINASETAGFGAYVDLWYNRGMAQRLVARGIPVTQWPSSAFSWAPDAHTLPPAFRAVANQNPRFLDSQTPQPRPMICTWDSWTTYYERDGYDQDGDMLTDEGTNGIDDDGVNGVDDPEEVETHPPYPIHEHNEVDDNLDGTVDDSNEQTASSSVPVRSLLRGIQVRIRMYEPGTRQTRQSTVVADFVSE